MFTKSARTAVSHGLMCNSTKGPEEKFQDDEYKFFVDELICDALHDFGSNAYKKHSNGWPKCHSS